MQLFRVKVTNSNYVIQNQFFDEIIQVEQFKFKYKWFSQHIA